MSLKNELLERLKEEGLNVGEEVAVQVVRGLFKVLPVVLAKTPSKLDDLLIPVLGVVEGKVMSLLDKIDGEDDPGR